jgi:iron(III) transport system permease protein
MRVDTRAAAADRRATAPSSVTSTSTLSSDEPLVTELPDHGRGEPGPGSVLAFLRRRRFDRWLAGWVLLLVVGVPSIVPIFYVVANSFSDSRLGEAWNFSLEPWGRVFDSPNTFDSIVNSFILAIRVPIGIAIAFCCSWLLVRVDVPGRRVILYALWFTFFLPSLPLTLGWILLAHEDYGLLNEGLMVLPFIDGPVLNIESIPGILWVHLTLATIPIMTLLLSPALQQLDSSYEEASDVSGAKVGTTLRRVTAFLILPTILTAFVAGLIRALEVFEVERLLGSRKGIFVYSTRLYDLFRETPSDYPQAMALSTLFLALLIVVGLLYHLGLRRSENTFTITGRGGRFVPRERTWRAWVTSVFLFAALAFTIGLPFAVLVLGSFSRLFGFFFIDRPWTAEHWEAVFTNSSFTTASRNTLIIATIVAVVGALIYSVLATVLARSRLWSRGAVSLLVWLPWAVPGVLMGTAFLNIFLNTPLLSGFLATLVPLILVLVIQSLPLGTHMMRSAVGQVSTELEEASQMSGANWLVTFRRITLPLAAPTFLSVLVLVFMAAVRDISATVLLATPGTNTLSLLMFSYASVGQLEEAAVIGVLVAVVALLMTAVVFKLGARFSIGA